MLHIRCPSGTDSSSSSSSSSGSRDSRSIARRARHTASLARQETRRELIKSRSKRSSIPEHGDASSRSLLKTCSALSKPPPSSPFRRGLYYICDHFLPNFLSPRKPTKANKRALSIAYSVREDSDPCPEDEDDDDDDDDDVAQVPPPPPQPHAPAFDDLMSVDFSSESDTFTISDESSLDDGSPTPYADLRRREREAEERDGDGHHERCGLGLEEGETCEGCEVDRKWFKEWVEGIGRDDAHLHVADVQKMLRDVRKEAMKLENDFDLQRRAWADEVAEQEERREDRERRGGASETRAAHRTRFHPYATKKRIYGKRVVNLDPLVSLYADYEHQWMLIRQYAFPTFTFADIPWPLLSPPRSPEDVTVARVHDFMRLVKPTPEYTPAESLPWLAMLELRKWNHDIFAELVLNRVIEDEEAEVVRSAANVVKEALKELVMQAHLRSARA